MSLKVKFLMLNTILVMLSMGWAENQRPNILFIHMEDMGCEIPAYGDDVQETPALSKLAEEGMVFERVNVTAPSCAPSRGSLFSGLYPHQNGMWAFDQTHGFHYREGIVTFVQLLKKAGYATGISYKKGVEPKEAVPFDKNYNYAKNALGHKETSHKVSNCIDGFQHFLENLPKGQPFYFQAQTNDTHVIWADKRYEPIRGMKTQYGMRPIDKSKIKPLPHWGKVVMDKKVKDFLATYYGAIQRVDYYVSEVLRLLEENGHTENTLVVFSSDHGPSDLFRGKTTSYEFGLKVPFIAKWPGVIQGNQRSKAMVSFVDIMPTFLDVAGIDRPEWLPGASIVPVFRGETPNGHRKYLYSAYNSHTTRKDLFWPGRTINDGRYKLIHHLLADGELAREGKQGANARFVGMLRSTEEMKKLYTETVTPPSYQLYDLQSDPAELNDLSKNPEYAPVLARLKKDLFKWRKDIVKDPFVDEEVLKDFTEEYYAHCQIFEDMMEKHGKKGLQKMKWKLDKERWIPVWNPAPYGPEH